jgi:uncharacterized lipoprotein YmbA
MMVRRIVHALSLVVVAACASNNARFYTLDSTATEEAAPAATYAVAVGPVSVPASVDRPQFVVQVAPNRVVLDEFNRWAAPLDDSIARAVAGNLAVLLGTPRVVTAPLPPGFVPAYRVAINVQRFESVQGEGVTVEALWSVQRSGSGSARSGLTVAHEPLEGDRFDAFPAAHSRAFAKVSSDIAAAIREDAATRR